MTDLQTCLPEDEVHYLDIFAGRDLKRPFIKWSWPAFFFGGLWLIYRRAYILGVGLMLTAYAFMMLMLMLGGSGAGHITMLLCQIAAGCYGNFIYGSWLHKLSVHGEPFPRPGWASATIAILASIVCPLLFGLLLVLLFGVWF